MSDANSLLDQSVSQEFCAWATALDANAIPTDVQTALNNALLDFTGLCVAARDLDYVQAMITACSAPGDCTAIGQAEPVDIASAALINGTAAHGEDYDDTFEGTPVHTGAVIMPAVLAAAEKFNLAGQDTLRGIAVGTELMCRMALVAPTGVHRAGFHPTAVIGAIGAAAGVSAALGSTKQEMTDSIGIAGSFASGIIEYLAEGSWTKRLHAGWAAQSGIRAALLGREKFMGPRTVMEGEHGFFFGFSSTTIPNDFTKITDDLGQSWHAATIAFKPYACGTMTQPFIDCAIQLAQQGISPDDITDIICDVGEGTVHRLWEPLSEKRNPSTAYSAKFSVPYCVAVGIVDQAAGLAQFTEERVADQAIRELANRVSYEIDLKNEYPTNYSGHLRATLKDGSVREIEQPHMRGGAHEALPHNELIAKFKANIAFGGSSESTADRLQAFCESMTQADNLKELSSFRLPAS
ncbi:MAG: MmgE/PrpD family protein [Alphaproteobacteria bacterium]|nr:MmgE/PrpD family protein [Alphaproteobacteria bacterium]